MENKDYTVEILEIIRSNTSPGIMRSRLEDYHANDLAEVFPQLKVSERRKICRILDLDMLSDIFEHIDEQEAAEYLDEMDIKSGSDPFGNGDGRSCGCSADDSEREEKSADRING